MNNSYWVEPVYASDFENDPCEFTVMCGNTRRVAVFELLRHAEMMVKELEQCYFENIQQAKDFAKRIKFENKWK